MLMSLPLLLGGIYISISSNSWFMLWVGMEMNFMGFMVIMTMFSSMNSMIIYFLTQVLASSLFLVSSFYYPMLIYLPLLIKLGVAPFHFWMVQIAMGMKWFSLSILLTLQKIIPLIILMMSKLNITIYFIIITSIVGVIMMFNQMQMKLIMVYSSVTNSAWMLCPMGMLFYTIYSVGLVVMISLISKIWSLSQLTTLNLMHKLTIMSNLLSLGGFPPLSGFFPKILILTEMIELNMLLALILVFTSLLNIYLYIRMCNVFLLLNYSSKVQFNTNVDKFMGLALVWPLLGMWFTY